uniref:Uncharacterized protein n=1 Tax=Bursaphelenchus xylophilus TaxID=6326 RepID=A0A1I7SEW0_BURXY
MRKEWFISPRERASLSRLLPSSNPPTYGTPPNPNLTVKSRRCLIPKRSTIPAPATVNVAIKKLEHLGSGFTECQKKRGHKR